MIVENGGVIKPYYSTLGDSISQITVNGGVRIGEGGQYEAYGMNAPGPSPGTLHKASDRLIVNGLLDLSAVGDVLNFSGYFAAPASVTIAEYQNRLGEFDIVMASVGTLPNASVSVSYTSASNGGPGQVIVTVTPEPGVAGLLGLGLGIAGLRRHRSLSPAPSEARRGGRW